METKRLVKTGFLLILLVFWLSAPALGDFFKYVDDSGQMHFTDDPANIPEKYRDQLKTELKEWYDETESDYNRFIDHGDGSVTDTKTGLVWLKDLDAHDGITFEKDFDYNYSDVLAYTLKDGRFVPLVNGQVVGNSLYIRESGERHYVRNKWRLPTLQELRELVYANGEMPADEGIELPQGHPFKNVDIYYYWTSTKPWQKISNGKSTDSCWTVLDLKTGSTHWAGPYNSSYDIWPVRNGP